MLLGTRLKSSQVLECRHILQPLLDNNTVTLEWGPEHSGATGNENYDELPPLIFCALKLVLEVQGIRHLLVTLALCQVAELYFKCKEQILSLSRSVVFLSNFTTWVYLTAFYV